MTFQWFLSATTSWYLSLTLVDRVWGISPLASRLVQWNFVVFIYVIDSIKWKKLGLKRFMGLCMELEMFSCYAIKWHVYKYIKKEIENRRKHFINYCYNWQALLRALHGIASTILFERHVVFASWDFEGWKCFHWRGKRSSDEAGASWI